MKNILIADVIKLRNITGVGVLDAKNALFESNGNFDQAINFLRKKGKKIFTNRLDKQPLEGVVLTKININRSIALIMSLNCETDFVAKNNFFLEFAYSLLDIGIKHENKSSLLKSEINGVKVQDKLIDHMNMMGEKIEIGFFKKIFAPSVGSYVHLGNKIGAIVGFSEKIQNSKELGKEICMQIVAMNPIAINKDELDVYIIEKELDIYRHLFRKEGKPENIIEDISKKKLNKFFKEKILINQKFINNEKLTVQEYLHSLKNGLKIVSFERVSLR